MTADNPVSDAALLAECEVHTLRASGPGGQKRNKTESAVRLRHGPTGIIVVASESRSQAENRARALKRLRQALALRVRHAVDDATVRTVRGAIGKDGRLRMGQRDARYLPIAGALLDLLAAHQGSVRDVAERLGITTGTVSRFITADEGLMVEANRMRSALGLKLLRDD